MVVGSIQGSHRVRQRCALSWIRDASFRVCFYLFSQVECFFSAYADDVVVFRNHDIDVLISVTDKYSLVSSAMANWGQTEALGVGERCLGLLQVLTWYLVPGQTLGARVQKKEVVEKVEGKLMRWKWLQPKRFF